MHNSRAQHLVQTKCAQVLCTHDHSDPGPRPRRPSSPASGSTPPACEVLAHPLRSRLLVQPARRRARHRHRPGRRARHQLRRHVLPPAQARGGRPGRRHRRGRGQAPALARRPPTSTHCDPSDFVGDEDSETALELAGPRLRCATSPSKAERWLDAAATLARRVAGRLRHAATTWSLRHRRAAAAMRAEIDDVVRALPPGRPGQPRGQARRGLPLRLPARPRPDTASGPR